MPRTVPGWGWAFARTSIGPETLGISQLLRQGYAIRFSLSLPSGKDRLLPVRSVRNRRTGVHPGLNEHWDGPAGAGPYRLRRGSRDGKLFIYRFRRAAELPPCRSRVCRLTREPRANRLQILKFSQS